MKGAGAIVFLAAFFATLAATLAYPTMPPGPQLYSLLNVPTTDYPVLGIPATTLIIAVFNGVIYGIIAWLAYTVLNKTGIIK
jgi:di/tricarboxylate transporter